MHQSTDPTIMLNPENNDIYSLSDVLQVLNIKTYWYDYTDQLQALQKIKQAYHDNLKHQPELKSLHESELINQLHDLQLLYAPVVNEPTNSDIQIDYTRVNYLSDLARYRPEHFIKWFELANKLMPSVTARILNLPKWMHSEQNPNNQ